MGYSKRRLAMGEESWEIYQKKRRSKKVVNWRKRTKRKLIKYKGSKCLICGYDKDVPPVYDFHHRDRDIKEFMISKSYGKSFDKLKKEVDKCDLLCGNCHQELHYKEYETKAVV